MPLAEIQNNPSTPQQLASWSFAHMANHRDINRLLQQKRDTQGTEYVLDPFDPTHESFESWMDQHQQMHNQQNAALGIAGHNLSDVKWDDAVQREKWIFAHADEHNRAGTILGVT